MWRACERRPEVAEQVDLVLVRGEDYVAQIFWSDQWNEPVPVTEPVEATVKDMVGQTVLRFVSATDPNVGPCITHNSQGFFQLTVPSSRTWTLASGTYTFDLWADVVDSAAPFTGQRQQVVQGIMTVIQPVSTYTQN